MGVVKGGKLGALLGGLEMAELFLLLGERVLKKRIQTTWRRRWVERKFVKGRWVERRGTLARVFVEFKSKYVPLAEHVSLAADHGE